MRTTKEGRRLYHARTCVIRQDQAEACACGAVRGPPSASSEGRLIDNVSRADRRRRKRPAAKNPQGAVKRANWYRRNVIGRTLRDGHRFEFRELFRARGNGGTKPRVRGVGRQSG